MKHLPGLAVLLVLGGCNGDRLGLPLPIDSGMLSPLPLGAACDPYSPVDFCTLDGYVCNQHLDGGGNCATPIFGDPCMPSVGCGDGGLVFCGLFPIPIQDGGFENEGYCATGCVTAQDCPYPWMDCFGLADGDAGCQFDPCANVDAVCPSAGSLEGGTCISTGVGPLCFSNGSAPLGSPCSETRVDGGEYLCGGGDACLSGSGNDSACVALCANSGQACPNGSICRPDLPVCAPTCATTADCAGPFTCGIPTDENGNRVIDAGLICLLP